MSEFEEVMWEAWNKVWPRLKADPDELRARLARRRSKMFSRPLRAMCLAVRASDRRINLATAILTPEDALDVDSEWHPGRVVEHEVVLDARLLRKICGPVQIEPPGELHDDVAKKLGVHTTSLFALRRNGTLRVHYVKGLCGRRGKQVPLLFTWEDLDPGAYGKAAPGGMWAGLWRLHAGALPDDFEAAVVRVPRYVRQGRVDRLIGWRWVCPGCKREVRTVYLPMKVPDWGRYVGLDRLRIGDCGLRNDPHPGPLPEGEGRIRAARGAAAGRVRVDEVDRVPEPVRVFACQKCHGVQSLGAADATRAWNQVVLQFSGGLMYGEEVRRPEWMKEERKRAFRRRGRQARPRQDEIRRLLVETELTPAEIARELGVSYRTVTALIHRMRRRYGVTKRNGLREEVRRFSILDL